MSDYGMKVTKVGKDIASTDIRDWILHSDYSMFKYNSTLTGSITITAGNSTGSLEVTHNLGYVPAFLVYVDNQLFPTEIKAYATTTKVHIDRTLSTPYDQTSLTYLAQEAYWEDTIIGFHIVAGNRSGSDGSAVRFINVAIPQGKTLISSQLNYMVGTIGSGDVKFKIYGIDEDNTGSFSSNPMGRTKTDAVSTKTQSQQGSWFNFSDNCVSQVQEIVNRSGWTSGNAMGFIFNDNSSTGGDYLITRHTDNFTLDELYLNVVFNGTNSEVTNYKVIIFKDKISS